MTLTHLLGWTALFITIVYTCVGLPSQIRRNHASKSTTGLSLFMIVMLSLTFSAWLAYGLATSPRNWFLVGSNVPGAIFVVVILYQFWIYRSRSRGKPAA